ncbi:MAG TPA: hypothetical protein VIY53_21240 [Acidobacteriaceae bacterium]
MRSAVLGAMHRIGLRPGNDASVGYTVWNVTASGWIIAEGDYSKVSGQDLFICELILTIDPRGRATPLRELPFEKTDVDGKSLTTWDLVDAVPIENQNPPDIILRGDWYENHWLEVEGFRNDSWRLIFSGLGYYL